MLNKKEWEKRNEKILSGYISELGLMAGRKRILFRWPRSTTFVTVFSNCIFDFSVLSNFSSLLKSGKFSCTLNQWVIGIWLGSTWASFASLMTALPSSGSDKQASEEFLSAYMGSTSVSVPLCFSLDFSARKLMQVSEAPFTLSHFWPRVFVIGAPYMDEIDNSQFFPAIFEWFRNHCHVFP